MTKIVDAFVNPDPGTYLWLRKIKDVHSRVKDNEKLSTYYQMVRSAIEGDLLNVERINASMPADIYSGVTNEKIYIGWGHDDTYWYEEGEQYLSLSAEAWAEYFSAKIRNDERNISDNLSFFPLAASNGENKGSLEQMADDLLDFYVTYYSALEQ